MVRMCILLRSQTLLLDFYVLVYGDGGKEQGRF